MRLLVQPGDGIQALIKGIAGAKRSVEIVIFRFDRSDLERALASAVTRGVSVSALIASTNRFGEANLRKLELRLLSVGVTVSRTASDLVRYHSKLLIVDRRELYLLAFNLTHADIERSRSFAVISTNRDVVRDAVRLFDADAKRVPFEGLPEKLVVSPINARKELAAFIQGAKQSLVVYDPKVSDQAMMRLLAERAQAGVNIRVIGTVLRPIPGVTARQLPNLRLHTRSMVRDGKFAFVGSQSLREAELDARREVGLIFREPKLVARLLQTFDTDWAKGDGTGQKIEAADPNARIVRKFAKAVAKEMPAMTPMVNGALKQMVGDLRDVTLVSEEVEEMVRGAVKEAVKAVVMDAVEDAVERRAAVSK